MASRQYRNGPRKKSDGKMSDSRYAWLRTVVGQFVMHRHADPGIPGPSILLYLPRPTGRPLSFDMTALTAEELALTRQFFNLLFDQAEPVCAARDKVAHDAFAEGDDTHARIYRQVPQLVVREGAIGTDREELLDGPEDDAQGPQHDGGPAGGVRGDGDELAPGDAQDGGPEDDGT